MVLQNLVFPQKEICEETLLYYRPKKGDVSLKDGNMRLSKGTVVNFCTYFNLFSWRKWKKYTGISRVAFFLTCQGKVKISLYHSEARLRDDSGRQIGNPEIYRGGDDEKGNTENRDCIVEMSFDRRECRVELPDGFDGRGLIYAEVEALGEVVIEGGGYSELSEMPVNEITMAIGICTYRREEYVERTLKTLRERFLQPEESPLREHLHVYVSDNGQTLPAEQLSSERVHVFPNKNAGGAGGFGRCMVEAVRAREKYKFTHVLLMDDDIILEPESLYRTYTFLSCQKSEYAGYLFGGALLRLDVPFIQHANGELWNEGKMVFTKRGYDLRREMALQINEEELPVEYNGWWYCCIPIPEKVERFFPLPLFIHRDDVEHCLRYSGRIITMNGVGVWHNAFDNRRASSMEYYNIRNELICNVIHYPEYSAKRAVRMVAKHMVSLLLKLRYEDQLLVLRGVEDFCRGASFLSEKDPVELNQEIMKMGYRQEDVSEELKAYGDTEYDNPRQAGQLYEEIGFSLKEKLTLNGWLLPGRKKCFPVPFGAHPRYMYRGKRVLLYEPETGKGIHVTRRFGQLFVTINRCRKANRLLKKNFVTAAQSFLGEGMTLMGLEFWSKYLH